MKSQSFVIFLLLLSECIFMAHSMPVNVTSTPTPSVEYDSPSATEVVFEETASEINANGDNEDDSSQSTTLSPDIAQSDDIPGTTSAPCGNDIESPDCPLANLESDDHTQISGKTDNDPSASEDSAAEEKGTTVQP